MATPRALRSAMTRNRISTSAALSAEVGSSMIRMRASSDTALAISTSCCWPMRRSSTSMSGPDAGFQPLEELCGARRSCALWSILRSRLVISRVAKMFSATDRLPNRLSSWNTMPMPRRDRVARRCERDLLAVEEDPAERRLLDAGDDLHQRRFAGAVLADQHVDGALADLEIGALDRDGAGIDLRDVLELAG